MEQESTNVDRTPHALRGVLTRAGEAVGDRLNPILIKETRQALKSRQFTLWFVLLLIACWITTIGAIAWIGPSIYYLSTGGYLLYAYYLILSLPLVVVVPFSAYRSLSSEHEENTRDLLEVSSLSPRQIINGKLSSAALQIVVYCSALAPCIAFTYLLRGVEIVTILLLIAYAALASIGLSAVGVAVAAATRQKYAQVVFSVVLAGGLFVVYSALLTQAAEVLRLDSTTLRSEEYWWEQLALLCLYGTTLAVVYNAAIALTTFSSANRSTPLRIALFVQQAVFVGWVAAGVFVGTTRDNVFLSFATAAVYWFAAGAVMTGESPSLSLRVRRSLPQSFLGRALGTWFNPGAGTGYAFAVANVLVLAAMAVFLGVPFSQGGDMLPSAAQVAIAILACYVVAYLGIGRLAIIGLRRVAELSLLGCFLVQVLITLGGSGMPFVVDTLTDRVRVADSPLLTVPSPVWNLQRMESGQMGSAQEVILLVTVSCFAAAVLLVNLALAGSEARQLRVVTPKRVIEDELERSPPSEEKPTNPWGDRRDALTEPN